LPQLTIERKEKEKSKKKQKKIVRNFFLHPSNPLFSRMFGNALEVCEPNRIVKKLTRLINGTIPHPAFLSVICASVTAKLSRRPHKYGANYQAQILRVESHDPVHKLIPSLLTPRQLTRLSCPVRVPTRSPRSTSQTLHSKSSYPAKSRRPETENATEVIPQRI